MICTKTETKINKKILNKLEEKENIVMNDNKNFLNKKTSKENEFNSKIKNFLKSNNSNCTVSNNQGRLMKKENVNNSKHPKIITSNHQGKDTNIILNEEKYEKLDVISNFDKNTNDLSHSNNFNENKNLNRKSDYLKTLDNKNNKFESCGKDQNLIIKDNNKNLVRVNLKKHNSNLLEINKNISKLYNENEINCNENNSTNYLKKKNNKNILDEASQFVVINENNQTCFKNDLKEKTKNPFENKSKIQNKTQNKINNSNLTNSFEYDRNDLNNQCFIHEKFRFSRENNFKYNNSKNKENNTFSTNKNLINKIEISNNTNDKKKKTVNQNISKIKQLNKLEISVGSRITSEKISTTNKNQEIKTIDVEEYKNFAHLDISKDSSIKESFNSINRNRKILKNSKSRNNDFLKANSNLTYKGKDINYNQNKQIEEKRKNFNHVKIIEENQSQLLDISDIFNSDDHNKLSNKTIVNKSTKSIYINQSNKLLINLLNSNDSTYKDKLCSIAGKFKNYLNAIILFVSDHENLSNNISIYKNLAKVILNSALDYSKLNLNDLIINYCEKSKIDPTENAIKILFENLEKHVKFEIENLLLGISPILLDCNIIRHNFIDTYQKSRKNVNVSVISNKEIIQENIEQIHERSEKRIGKLLIIFQEMKDDLKEIDNLLLNHFGNNLVDKFKQIKNHDYTRILNDNNYNFNKGNNLCNKSIVNEAELEDRKKKNNYVQIRKTSRFIEIDLSNDKNKFDKIYNIIANKRKSLFDILNYDEKTENNQNKSLPRIDDENTNSESELEKSNLSEDKNFMDKKLNQVSIITKENNLIIENDSNIVKDSKVVSNPNTKNYSSSIKNRKFMKSKKDDSKIKDKNKALYINEKKPKKGNIDLINNKTSTAALKTTLKNMLKSLPITSLKNNLIKSDAENKENKKKNFEKKKKIEFNSEYNCIPNNTQNTNLLINNKTKKDELELKVKSNKNLNHLVETIKSNVSEYTSNLNKESDFNFNSEHKENFVSEEKDKNLLNTSNYININVNINQIGNIENPNEKRSTKKYCLNSNASKSEKNLIDVNLIYKKNIRKSKYNLNENQNHKIAYWNFSHLARQSKIIKENKIKHEKETLSMDESFSNDSREYSDIMASVDEFESSERDHFDIPFSSINNTNMPTFGSKIVRRHSSFSKVLEKFNYKRFFDFSAKETFTFNYKQKNFNLKTNIDNNLSVERLNITNKDIYLDKTQIISLGYKNQDYIKSPYLDQVEYKNSGLRKFNMSEKNCEMNKSAPDLSISVEEINIDNFKCYNI